MDIFVTSVRDVYSTVCAKDITHVLTLLTRDERSMVKLPSFFDRANYLFLEMDDVIDANTPGSPKKEQVAHMLNWASKIPDDAKLLVHCFAGVSRSTAAALAIRVQKDGLDKLVESIDWLVNHRPIACPNPVITQYADELLNAGGVFFNHAEAVAKSRLINSYHSANVMGWRGTLE